MIQRRCVVGTSSARFTSFVVLTTALMGCVPSKEAGAPKSEVQAPLPPAPALAVPGTALVCQGTGAHDTHAAQGFSCQVCHPCGGLITLAPGQTLPSGLPLTGTLTSTGSTTNCSVSCHQPVGQPTTTITWDSKGPLSCSSCHEQGLPPPAGGSYHPRDNSSVSANRAACQACHDLSGHVSGMIKIQTPSGLVTFPRGSGGSAAANPACESCHVSGGHPLAGQTPPMLVGWTDTVAGDFHGARVGTGSGGTLYPPYYRGQGPLPCSACHDPHSSSNAFLFAKKVNGVTIPEGRISKSGVGGELLCTACHQGQRHALCMTCHGGVDPEPAGSACFTCHGHEGIRYIPLPVTPMHKSSGGQGTNLACGHCHSPGWEPLPEATPPIITSVIAGNVTGTSATITWTTDEAASSFVEFGPAGPDFVSGSGGLVRSHVVTLTGLTGPTIYQYRVRSADLYRNESVSNVATFATADPRAPATPSGLIEFGDYTWSDPYPVPLVWSPVTAPLGNPIQYQVEVWTLSGGIAADSGWISGPTWTVPLSPQLWPLQYFWHVRARDTTLAVNSNWSATSSIYLWWWDY